MGLGRGFGGGGGGAEPSGAAQLLAASLLSLCFLLPGAHNGTPEPPMVLVEGDSLALRSHPLPENATRCTWYRGTGFMGLIFSLSLPASILPSLYGPGYTGHERMDWDCSIRFRKVEVRHSGTYTREVEGPGLEETLTLDLQVVEILSKPTLSISSKRFPREALDSLQLTCDTKATHANISWLLNGSRVETSPRIQLSDRNRTLAIQQVLREDAGNYQCQVFNLAFNKISNVLYVPVVYPPFPDSLGSGAIAGIVIGSLAVGLALVGALAYFFLRINRKGKETASASVSYAPSSHGNVVL
ncbi:carcinoembryonic antigen-related cell adhesion molecule 1-like [Sceloporus undulatus]|uniref:carcinoembryonic antigen-related cell adhesion molecule 1-like n=1 Tax=Sceloporus undulatus TaxID=8520 RepID=UPI001C4BEC77|nr:carcinoembryonic antigen-related cell adhesion molecule 1-like [Sceloporus undulatus]